MEREIYEAFISGAGMDEYYHSEDVEEVYEWFLERANELADHDHDAQPPEFSEVYFMDVEYTTNSGITLSMSSRIVDDDEEFY